MIPTSTTSSIQSSSSATRPNVNSATTSTTETTSATPPLWTYSSNGTINSISMSGKGEYTAVGVGYGETGGAVLLFDRGGDLLWQYQTDMIITHVAISDNGSHIVATGFQYPPTLPSILSKAATAIYALDSDGSVAWTRTASSARDLSFEGAISSDGLLVAVASPDASLAVLDWQGQVLWNDSAPVANAPVVFQNGSLFVDGTNGTSVFGPSGNLLWTDNGANNVWSGGVAITPTGYLVATSYDAGDNNPGMIMLLSGNGTLLWEHTDESGAYSAAVLPDGSSVAFTAAEGRVLFFSRNGTLLGDLTTPSDYPSVFPAPKDSFLVGGGHSSGLWLFNSTGGQTWSYPLKDVGTVSISSDANFAAASNGTGALALERQKAPLSTLYFFSMSMATVMNPLHKVTFQQVRYCNQYNILPWAVTLEGITQVQPHNQTLPLPSNTFSTVVPDQNLTRINFDVLSGTYNYTIIGGAPPGGELYVGNGYQSGTVIVNGSDVTVSVGVQLSFTCTSSTKAP